MDKDALAGLPEVTAEEVIASAQETDKAQDDLTGGLD